MMKPAALEDQKFPERSCYPGSNGVGVGKRDNDILFSDLKKKKEDAFGKFQL